MGLAGEIQMMPLFSTGLRSLAVRAGIFTSVPDPPPLSPASVAGKTLFCSRSLRLSFYSILSFSPEFL